MILVLSTYRSASTWYCSALAERNTLYNYDELFHESQCDLHKQSLRELARNNSCVVKIFPYHFSSTPVPLLIDKLINIASEVHVVVRKDFDAQLRSYYIAKQLRDWHSDIDSAAVTYDDEKWQQYHKFLYNQHVELSNIVKSIVTVPCLIKYTEDFPQTSKYKRTVTWDRQPPAVTTDIISLYQ